MVAPGSVDDVVLRVLLVLDELAVELVELLVEVVVLKVLAVLLVLELVEVVETVVLVEVVVELDVGDHSRSVSFQIISVPNHMTSDKTSPSQVLIPILFSFTGLC